MNIFKRDISVSRNELEAYIGERSYSPFFAKALNNYMFDPNIINWCWPSFFIGIYWLLFRKAILPALVLVFVNFIILNFIPMAFASLISLVILVFLGIYGTNLYLFLAEKKISQIKAQNAFNSEDELLATLTLQGGTTWTYPLALYIVQFVLYNLA